MNIKLFSYIAFFFFAGSVNAAEVATSVSEYSRAFERLSIVAAGIFTVYLGYKLYVLGINNLQEIEMDPPKYGIKFLRVGPGTLFALFGCWILVNSTNAVLRIAPPVISDTGEISDGGIVYAVGQGTEAQIRALNTLVYLFSNGAPDSLTPQEINSINNSMFQIEGFRNSILNEIFGVQEYSDYITNRKSFLDDPENFSEERASSFELIEKISTSRL